MARRQSSLIPVSEPGSNSIARDLSYETLKERQRALRSTFQESLSLRTHRALSWLGRAEQEQADDDARFIFLWIAFNAAYANEIHDRQKFSERRLLLAFLQRLIDSDRERCLYRAVWDHFSASIRLLIDNRHVFQPYWDYQNGRICEAEWQERFARSKSRAIRALGHMDTKKVLAVAFDRLYVLRNQLLHGGSTWNSSVNRSQIRDGARILGFIVPIVIDLMMDEAKQFWAAPSYPVTP